MIVKVTVHDNDFSGILEIFMKKFYMNVVYLKVDNTLDTQMQLDKFRKQRELNYLMNPNQDTEWNEENKRVVIEAVKLGFAEFIKSEPKDEQEYMLRNLEVEVIDSLKDEWENGENFYWFQHGDCVVNL